MSLLDLFLDPAPIHGQYVRRESPLGPWPKMNEPLTREEIVASRRADRLAYNLSRRKPKETA